MGYSLTESVYCGNGNLRVPFLANTFSTYLFLVGDSHLLLTSSRLSEGLLNGIPSSLVRPSGEYSWQDDTPLHQDALKITSIHLYQGSRLKETYPV